MSSRQALGRGLTALFGDAPRQTGEMLTDISVDSIVPGAEQPREDFKEDKLAELAKSIQANGFIQPIVVRRERKGRYELIAGERRWRAARSLGLKTIPAIVREVDPQRRLELALVENLQREDLNPIEEARAFEVLMRDHGLTQEQIAERVGKDRASVANTLRLLKLPDDVQAKVRAGELSMGHARALLGLGNVEAMRKAEVRISSEGLSVRQVEELVRAEGGRRTGQKPQTQSQGKEKEQESVPKDVHDKAAEKKLTAALQTKVEIRRDKRGGQISIHFYSEEELMRVYDLLMKKEKVGR